jgi:plastocyanin
MGLLLPALALACAAALVVGCGDDDSEPAAPRTVVLDDYEFRPRTVKARRGETLTVLNEGGTAHNLTVRRGSTKPAATDSFLKGDRARLRIDLPPGRYRILCTVPGHRQLGMTGTLVVG